MIVIQGAFPASGNGPKIGQANPQDQVQAEAFGISMLLALVPQQSTPSMPQRTPPQALSEVVDPKSDGGHASNRQPLPKGSVVGVVPENPAVPSAGSATNTVGNPGEAPAVGGRSPIQLEHQAAPQAGLPESRGTTSHTAEVGEGVQKSSLQSVETDARPRQTNGVVSLPEDVERPVKAPVIGTDAMAKLSETTIESTDLASTRVEAKHHDRQPAERQSGIANRGGEHPGVGARSEATERLPLHSGVVPPTRDKGLRPHNASIPGTLEESIERSAGRKLPQDDVVIEALKRGKDAAPKQMQHAQSQPQPQPRQHEVSDRTQPRVLERAGTRESQPESKPSVVGENTGAEVRTDSTSEGDRRVVSRNEVDAAVETGSQRRARTGRNAAVQLDVAAPAIGARPNGAVDTSTGQRQVEGQLEQPTIRTASEEAVFEPKPTDRVTLRFTDEGGVEGRLRVALRGQSVRATIVSGDPATAERIGGNVSELHRALDKQGFRDPQITVQQARGPEEGAGLGLASGVRSAPDSTAGSAAGRTVEDQANRDRQQPSARDQQQQQGGRSQQRSRERQER